MERRLRIVALLPGLAAHGGIQRHNRTLCKVLAAYAARRSGSLEVVSLSDPAGWYDERYLTHPVIGAGANRYRFAAQAVRALARPHDLLIVGVIDFGPLVIPARVRWPRAPILTITHGIEVWKPLPRRKRAALQLANSILAVSADTARQVVTQQRIPRAKIQVIPTPLDPDFLAEVTARQATGDSGIHTRLLSITRMNRADAGKGVDAVIRALPGVRSQVPDVNYVILGDGNDRPRLEQLAREHGVDDSVRFVGHVADQQLHRYLSGTDLFVLPSRKEGFGIVFLEAMAYGRPVIAGAHGGSPEVVVDGKTGILIGNSDHAALTSAITDLLRDSEKRRALGEAGRQRVHDVYTYDRFQARIVDVLDVLLADRTGGHHGKEI